MTSAPTLLSPPDDLTTVVFPGNESIVAFCVCSVATDEVQYASVTYHSAFHYTQNCFFASYVVKVVGAWPAIGKKLLP